MLQLEGVLRIADQHRTPSPSAPALAHEADAVRVLEIVRTLAVRKVFPGGHEPFEARRDAWVVALLVWVEVAVEDAAGETCYV